MSLLALDAAGPRQLSAIAMPNECLRGYLCKPKAIVEFIFNLSEDIVCAADADIFLIGATKVSYEI